MDNKKNEEVKVVEEKKEPIRKDPFKLERFEEIESKVGEAIDKGDIETILLMNELTLARNLENSKAQMKKEYNVVNVAFKGSEGVVKRSGVYNTRVIPNSEDAEDIVIGEDFRNENVLIIPRNSRFAVLI